DAARGVNIWGETYDTRATDSLKTQRTTAETISRASAAAILVCERARALAARPDEVGAWEAYQLGIWYMAGCNSDTIGVARRHFQQSIDLAPHFSAAHSALAWAHMMAASIYSQMAIAEGCELAQPLVMRAMALDERDPEAKARMALLNFLGGDVGGAIDEA